MNLIKQFFFLLAFASSSHAADLTGDLDLSHLDLATNAGQYQVQVDLNMKDQSEVLIERKMTGTTNPRCTTEITVDVGVVMLQLIDTKTAKTHQLVQNLKFHASDYSIDQTCPSTDFITSDYMRYDAHLTFSNSILLAYPSPAGYSPLRAQFAIFPYGYSAHLKATRLANDRFVISNLQQQLSNQLNRGNSDALQFEVKAKKGINTVSLGLGFITLK